MKLPILGTTIDERFFRHRLRSTSMAGMAAALLSGTLFLYRHFVDHVWNWDLFIVLATMAGVKMSLMAWYSFKD